jgi:uncharacterized ferredoxin-like protein
MNTQITYNWVQNYNGNFDFLLSLKSQLQAKGSLSDRQLDAAERCRLREIERSAPKAKTFSIAPGMVLEVKKSFAKKIAQMNGSSRVFFNLEVREVKAETAKAFLIKTKASGKVCGQCCMCGRALTDPQSILSGIGPVCADNYGIPYGSVEMTKEALESIATQEMEIETWIPKSTIKNLFDLQNKVDQSSAA